MLCHLSKVVHIATFYNISMRNLDVFKSCMLTFKRNVPASHALECDSGTKFVRGYLSHEHPNLHALSPFGNMNSILCL